MTSSKAVSVGPKTKMANLLRRLSTAPPVRVAALAAALTALGWVDFAYKFSVLDPDVYWHIAVGNWIVAHRAVPHTGILSRTAAELPWIAYSWGYEVLLSRAYAWIGLLGIGLFGVALTFLAAVALFWSVLRLSGRFWSAWALWVVTCSAFIFSLMPRPVFFSMALYVVVLTLLLQARRLGDIRLLCSLPLIFLIWANLHIQFVYGLFPIALLLITDLLQQLRAYLCGKHLGTSATAAVKLPSAPLAGLLGVCIVATCIGPYGYRLYSVILNYSRAAISYKYIQELQSIPFAYKQQFLIPLLAAGAYFALGRRIKNDVFELALLTICVAVAFRTQRDIWFLCITAALVIADTFAHSGIQERTAAMLEPKLKALELGGGIAVCCVLLLVIAPTTDFSARGLNRVMSRVWPIDACNYLRKNPLPGPMYNSFDWGGFLTWYLPMYPVSGDGRNDLYTDRLDTILLGTENELDSYKTNSYLNEAGFLLLSADSLLGNEVASDPRFRLVYNDDRAIIAVPKNEMDR